MTTQVITIHGRIISEAEAPGKHPRFHAMHPNCSGEPYRTERVSIGTRWMNKVWSIGLETAMMGRLIGMVIARKVEESSCLQRFKNESIQCKRTGFIA